MMSIERDMRSMKSWTPTALNVASCVDTKQVFVSGSPYEKPPTTGNDYGLQATATLQLGNILDLRK